MVIFDTTGPQVKLTYIDLENSTIISRFYIILHLCGKPHHFYGPHGFALAFPMVSMAFPPPTVAPSSVSGALLGGLLAFHDLLRAGGGAPAWLHLLARLLLSHGSWRW